MNASRNVSLSLGGVAAPRGMRARHGIAFAGVGAAAGVSLRPSRPAAASVAHLSPLRRPGAATLPRPSRTLVASAVASGGVGPGPAGRAPGGWRVFIPIGIFASHAFMMITQWPQVSYAGRGN